MDTQQQGYWERAADNLASWLGLQHLTTLDFLILQPLFPLLALGITWWLPWERWLWKDLPKTISGPYLLYCAFALWHFQVRWWLVSLVAIIGAGLCALALKDIHDRGKRRRNPSLTSRH
jgi:hypothetical protein